MGKLIIRKNIAKVEKTSTGLYTNEFTRLAIRKISSTDINDPNNVECIITT